VKYKTVLLLVTIGMLASCGASMEDQYRTALVAVEKGFATLAKGISTGTIRNAVILKQYSSVLKRQRPELEPLLNELELDATLSGPLYKGLQERLSSVSPDAGDLTLTEKIKELESLNQAIIPAVYNDALSDSVNVVADLSEGKLARVNAISREAELKANGAKDYGAGSQYIGNHHYGHWGHGMAGAYWMWGPRYSYFGSMYGGNRYFYNDWAGNRGYSYYHDVGRSSYTSARQRSTQKAVEQRAKKNYKSNKPFKSAYSKPRSGASGISKASSTQAKSAFKSPYASKSRSKYQSSARNSSSRTSRGTSRGK
jgi:hypothetical protein